MAAILDALAPYVKKLIADMAEEEVRMLLGVSGEITKLEDNIDSLKDYLADAERRRITDLSVQRWVTKLKGAMYDATDILDLCQLEADKRRESKGCGLKEAPGCLQPLLFCLRNPPFAHKIGSSIKVLNQRLDDIHKGAAKFNFISSLSSCPDPKMFTDVEHSSRKTMFEFDESAIVGEKIKKDSKELVQVLVTNDSHNIKVVSIVGMGGMGKTTLAQKIFNDTMIQEHFKVKIWLCITQHFDQAEILRTAISHAGGHHGLEQDISLLTQTLTNTLSASKFLLVMDDMWDDKAWSNVLSVPIKNANQNQPGSKVLITTRFEDLARLMQASIHLHHVHPLDKEDAWSLLKKQLPPDQVDGIHQLKGIGMGIVEKCGGLPLAIKVTGGLLSRKFPSEQEWKAVLDDPTWSVDGLPSELDNRIYLSYKDLCPELKQCFLYCSLIPKGLRLPRVIVTRKWISEGFIQPPIGSSGIEEIAIKYYRELITRNLIEPISETIFPGYHCTMHDVVRSFAQFLAAEESLVLHDEQAVAAATNSSNNRLVRRLSIGPNVSVEEYWATIQKQEPLRTLFIFCEINFKHAGPSLSSFSNLRVLLIIGAKDLDWLVDSLCQLKHLRFLHLESTDILRLPNDLDKMKFLQYIMLLRCNKLAHLPDSIIKLGQLRALGLEASNVKVVPKGFGMLTNLRSLSAFPVHMDLEGGWCSLEEIAPLSQLRELTLEGLENVFPGSLAVKAMIRTKKHLSSLHLHCERSRSVRPSALIEEVFDKLCPPPSLEHLFINGYFGRWLPNWMQVPASLSFKSLRYILLRDLSGCIQLPNGLCRLPSLEYLTINYAPIIKRVGPEFQSFPDGDGDAAATSSLSFPKLAYLKLVGLDNWEEWEWRLEEHASATVAMPHLEHLCIKYCNMLSHLPPGLANNKRHALRKLMLRSLANLRYVENFYSVVDLEVFNCPKLTRIRNLSRVQKIRISCCPNIKVLEDVPELDSLALKDATMETLPEYLRGVNPRYLKLDCRKKLYESLLPGSRSDAEWDKINHIRTQAIDCVQEEDEDSYSDENF